MSLKQKVVAAFGWSLAIKLGFQLVTWAMTLLVIRLLAPRDYGLMAIAQAFTGFLAAFTDMGLGDALLQRRDPSREMVRSTFGVLLVLSVLLMAGLMLAAGPIARWYADPRLVPLVRVAALGFLFNGLGTLPRMWLMKSLRVRPMFLMELSSGVVSSLTVVSLAYAGYGVWALMLGWLVGNLMRQAGYVVLTWHTYVRPSLNLAAVRPLLGYSSFRVLDYVAWVTFMSSDVFIIGRVLGAAQLGLYAVALNFASIPLSKVAPIVNSVAFPAFAMVQSEPAQARFYALKSLRLMALATVPVFFGLSATSPEIVHVVFGPKWAGAQPVLAIMSVAVTFRALLLVVPNYLQGIGDARGGFYCTAVGALVFPPAVLIGCAWGVLGVCCAWLLSYPLVFVVASWLAGRRGGLDVGAMLAAPVRPMLAGAAMMAALAGLRPLLPADWPEVARLAVLVAAGAAIYGAAMLVAGRAMVMELVRLVRPRVPAAQ